MGVRLSPPCRLIRASERHAALLPASTPIGARPRPIGARPSAVSASAGAPTRTVTRDVHHPSAPSDSSVKRPVSLDAGASLPSRFTLKRSALTASLGTDSKPTKARAMPGGRAVGLKRVGAPASVVSSTRTRKDTLLEPVGAKGENGAKIQSSVASRKLPLSQRPVAKAKPKGATLAKPLDEPHQDTHVQPHIVRGSSRASIRQKLLRPRDPYM